MTISSNSGHDSLRPHDVFNILREIDKHGFSIFKCVFLFFGKPKTHTFVVPSNRELRNYIVENFIVTDHVWEDNEICGCWATSVSDIKLHKCFKLSSSTRKWEEFSLNGFGNIGFSEDDIRPYHHVREHTCCYKCGCEHCRCEKNYAEDESVFSLVRSLGV